MWYAIDQVSGYRKGFFHPLADSRRVIGYRGERTSGRWRHATAGARFDARLQFRKSGTRK